MRSLHFGEEGRQGDRREAAGGREVVIRGSGGAPSQPALRHPHPGICPCAKHQPCNSPPPCTPPPPAHPSPHTPAGVSTPAPQAPRGAPCAPLPAHLASASTSAVLWGPQPRRFIRSSICLSRSSSSACPEKVSKLRALSPGSGVGCRRSGWWSRQPQRQRAWAGARARPGAGQGRQQAAPGGPCAAASHAVGAGAPPWGRWPGRLPPAAAAAAALLRTCSSGRSSGTANPRVASPLMPLSDSRATLATPAPPCSSSTSVTDACLLPRAVAECGARGLPVALPAALPAAAAAGGGRGGVPCACGVAVALLPAVEAAASSVEERMKGIGWESAVGRRGRTGGSGGSGEGGLGATPCCCCCVRVGVDGCCACCACCAACCARCWWMLGSSKGSPAGRGKGRAGAGSQPATPMWAPGTSESSCRAHQAGQGTQQRQAPRQRAPLTVGHCHVPPHGRCGGAVGRRSDAAVLAHSCCRRGPGDCRRGEWRAVRRDHRRRAHLREQRAGGRGRRLSCRDGRRRARTTRQCTQHSSSRLVRQAAGRQQAGSRQAAQRSAAPRPCSPPRPKCAAAASASAAAARAAAPPLPRGPRAARRPGC
jgi:hypothetical protein